MAPLSRTRALAASLVLLASASAAFSPGAAAQPPLPATETGQPSDLVNRPTCCMYEDLRTSYRCVFEAQ